MRKISFVQTSPVEFRPARSSSGGVFWPVMLMFLLLIGLLALVLKAVNSTVGTKPTTPVPKPTTTPDLKGDYSQPWY